MSWKLALRRCLRQPIGSLVVVVSLTVGLGLALAAWSLLESVVLSPLDHFDPEARIAVLWTTAPEVGIDRLLNSGPDIRDIAESVQSIEHLAPFESSELHLSGGRVPGNRAAMRIGPDFFKVTGLKALAGRLFEAGESQSVLLGEREWRRQFGNSSTPPKELLIGGETYTVVGILPELERFTQVPQDIWLPISETSKALRYRSARTLHVLVRIKAGRSLAQAQQELDTLAARLEESNPDTNSGVRFRLVDLGSQIVGDYQRALWLVQLATLLLLLLAAFNSVKVFISRLRQRRGEVGLRFALGASSSTAGRLVVAEMLVLTVPSLVAASALSYWLIAVLMPSLPLDIPRQADWSLDWSTVALLGGFGVLLVGATALVALSLFSSHRPFEELKGGMTRGRRKAAKAGLAMVAGEIAIAALFLSSGVLLVRSFVNVEWHSTGFSDSRIKVLAFQRRGLLFAEPAAERQFWRDLLLRLKERGIDTAAASTLLPIHSMYLREGLFMDGSSQQSEAGAMTPVAGATPGFFELLSIDLLKGRTFTDADRHQGQPSVVVSESFAKLHWPREDPIGKQIKGLSFQGSVVGVVEDIVISSLFAEPEPLVYYSSYQSDRHIAHHLYARTSMTNSEFEQVVLNTVESMGLDFKASQTLSLEAENDVFRAPFRLGSLLLMLLAACTCALAMGGVFGVVWEEVLLRRFECGVRLALGAPLTSLLHTVAGALIAASALGLLLGTGAAYFLSSYLSALLFEVERGDPWSLAVPAVLMLPAVIFISLQVVSRTGRRELSSLLTSQ